MLVYFLLTFFISAGVAFLFNLLVHGYGNFEWDLALQRGVVLGIVIPTARRFEGKR